MDTTLWQSREALWSSAPPAPIHGTAILDRYFRNRRVDIPQRPAPAFDRIAGAVLAARGSAPGLDGFPYELFHAGVNVVTHLLAHGLWAADAGLDQVVFVLGPTWTC